MAPVSLPISISEVNSLSDEQFESIFGNVIELCTDAAVEVKKKRPFQDVTALCDAFQSYLEDISLADKVVILKLHPDLAGRLAARGELTPESAGEQRAAGLDGLTAEQKRLIDESNQRYKLKFGFPFIICARENKVQSIIEGLQRRYNNSQEQEIVTGINEVQKICKLRILDIVKH
uniref:2-oxo-4-hydroxy-4-carboxy-5-ureidoimidazoline decarboxylase n=1 Tax=Heliothis virescens TaxID=7102 RepID=A0A2A4J319_HELVI